MGTTRWWTPGIALQKRRFAEKEKVNGQKGPCLDAKMSKKSLRCKKFSQLGFKFEKRRLHLSCANDYILLKTFILSEDEIVHACPICMGLISMKIIILFTEKWPSIADLENRDFIMPPRRHSFSLRKRSRVCTHFVKTSSPYFFFWDRRINVITFF